MRTEQNEVYCVSLAKQYMEIIDVVLNMIILYFQQHGAY